jgi:TRAP-type C4-dicarboxylate transport system substrate-binding protein
MFLLAGCVADTADKGFFIKATFANASEAERKMVKAAASASSERMRQARRAYEAEYLRSITGGGKDTAHDTANRAEWRDALQSTQST